MAQIGYMMDWLQQDPWGFVQYMLYRVPAVLLAIMMHEYAHGYAAYRSGDNTAKMLGRLSFNPLKHLDMWGTLSLFLLGFGWAKPVPVNPNNFRNKRRDDIIVSLAGVTVNFIMFLLFTLLSILVGKFLYQPEFFRSVGAEYMLSASQVGFLVQLDPAYAKELLPLLKTPWLLHVQRVLLHASMINLGLCLFNLLPIPPLDGFHVMNNLFFKGRIFMGGRNFQIMQSLFIILMLTTGFVSDIISKAIYGVQGAVLSGMLRLFGI